MRIIAGNSNLPLSENVSKYLGEKLTDASIRRFADEEVYVEIKENIRGEIDIWNPHHFIHMQSMFMRNAKRNETEKNMTQPEDAINKALMDYLNEG